MSMPDVQAEHIEPNVEAAQDDAQLPEHQRYLVELDLNAPVTVYEKSGDDYVVAGIFKPDSHVAFMGDATRFIDDVLVLIDSARNIGLGISPNKIGKKHDLSELEADRQIGRYALFLRSLGQQVEGLSPSSTWH